MTSVSFILGFLGEETTYAVSLDNAFTAVPSRFEDLNLTVPARALGEICYSRETMPDGTTCNPALLPYAPDSFVLGRVFIGNGYQNLTTAQQLLFENISDNFLNSLFTQNSVTSLEANLELDFATKYFTAQFSPYRVQYIAEVHNPNFPVVELHASLERQFVIATGFPLTVISNSLQGLTFGVSFQLIQRRFIDSEFSALDLVGTPVSQIIPIQTELVFNAEPTLAYESYLKKWKFIYSLGAVNTGFTNNPTSLYPAPIDAVAAIGVEPPLPAGSLKFGLDLVNIINGVGLSNRVNLGVSYKYGVFELMGGVNASAYTLGLEYGIKVLMAGIVYQIPRDILEGAPVEDTIATEFAIKF